MTASETLALLRKYMRMVHWGDGVCHVPGHFDDELEQQFGLTYDEFLILDRIAEKIRRKEDA